MSNAPWGRRDFLRLSAQASGGLALSQAANVLNPQQSWANTPSLCISPHETSHSFNGPYRGTALGQIAFPLGGIGAGMFCLEGTGALTKFSLRHRPDLAIERRVFAALSLPGLPQGSRVLEGPVPMWKLRPQFPGKGASPANSCWGLPRFRQATFEARFPFATVRLEDEALPVKVELTGWSPFCPGDADNASLPVAGLEYRFINQSSSAVEAVFSFHAENLMAVPQDPDNSSSHASAHIGASAGGFILCQAASVSRSWDEGYCAIWTTESDVQINSAWFRGIPNDQIRMLWNDVVSGRGGHRDPQPKSLSPGASIFVPFKLAPGEDRTITLYVAWYVPRSDLFEPDFFTTRNGQVKQIAHSGQATYRPWYATRFTNVGDVKSYWQSQYRHLRKVTDQFTLTFYKSTLPPEVLEAVAANLTILKSPTILRQADGRLWGWEGSYDEVGSCYGSSTHVWNYAQAIAHLFPELERGLRETELGPDLGNNGFEIIRSTLPIRPIGDDTREDGFACPAAADGQLGGIIKAFREWRISGDLAWLRRMWPRIKVSLDYCIRTWDPLGLGWLEQPRLTTYDVEFRGIDSLCTSLYLGALRTATLMGESLGENVSDYHKLLSKGIQKTEDELFDGEYFLQHVDSSAARAVFVPQDDDPWQAVYRQYPAMTELSREEGPLYQYGKGCLADGLFGVWLCLVCGAGDILARDKVESHLMAVYRHNFKKCLLDHSNAQRAILACGEESGLVVCTWPKGGRPSLPLFYADEVWTGIEYQVASHLIAFGHVDEGLDIVRSCRRRYDGSVRNPFAEVEEGQWYARAMSSYALLQAFSGARFDAVDCVLYLKPTLKGDFCCFLSTATGFGTVGVKGGQPFVEVVSGEIPYRRIDYTAA
jgi:uncharacterized protein (DUF608 family)